MGTATFGNNPDWVPGAHSQGRPPTAPAPPPVRPVEHIQLSQWTSATTTTWPPAPTEHGRRSAARAQGSPPRLRDRGTPGSRQPAAGRRPPAAVDRGDRGDLHDGRRRTCRTTHEAEPRTGS